jgi:hypothetical protein
MTTLIVLIVTLIVLAMGSELTDNWKDQWVPQYRKRMFGQTSPMGVIFVGVSMGVVGGVASAIVYGAGYLLQGDSWGWAWATLVVIFLCLNELRKMVLAARAARQYIHPKNPKGSFWP